MAGKIKQYLIGGRIPVENPYVRLMQQHNAIESQPGIWRGSAQFGIYESEAASKPAEDAEPRVLTGFIARPEPLFRFDVSAEWKKGEVADAAYYEAAKKQDICDGWVDA